MIRPHKHSFPDISVIIPVYNCSKTIEKCLDSLSSLEYPNYEIIIVDDGSTDDTAKICQSYHQTKVIRTVNGGPSRARNIGVREATGEIVAFTDGDCIVHRRWLNELANGFSREDIACVGGNQISPPDETDFGRYVQETFSVLGFATSYMKTHTNMTETRHNPSCNSAYRKSLFEKVGGFDELLWPGEDVDLDYRLNQLGYTLIRNPEAIVKHYRPQSLSELGSMMQRYGGSAFLLLKKYGFFRPLHYMPFILISVLLCVTAALIYKPSTGMFFLIVLSVLLLFFGVIRAFSKKTAMLFSLSLVIFINWHLGFFKHIFLSEERNNGESCSQ